MNGDNLIIAMAQCMRPTIKAKPETLFKHSSFKGLDMPDEQWEKARELGWRWDNRGFFYRESTVPLSETEVDQCRKLLFQR